MPHRALVVVAAVVVGLGLALPGAAQAAPALSPDPDAAVVGLPVQGTGTCDAATPSTRSTSRGVQVGLLRDGQPVVVAQAAPGAVPGSFTATLSVPGNLAPGAAILRSSCGGEATFTVLAAPTLALTSGQVAAGGQVTATGTCPAKTGSVTDLVLTGRRLAGSEIDATSGRFGPTAVPIPAGT